MYSSTVPSCTILRGISHLGWFFGQPHWRLGSVAKAGFPPNIATMLGRSLEQKQLQVPLHKSDIQHALPRNVPECRDDLRIFQAGDHLSHAWRDSTITCHICLTSWSWWWWCHSHLQHKGCSAAWNLVSVYSEDDCTPPNEDSECLATLPRSGTGDGSKVCKIQHHYARHSK